MNRKIMAVGYVWLMVLLLLGASRPNVVVITASNLGYSDLGCYGGEIQTPVLDALAAEGMQLTQFYSCGESTHTQTSLMTGQAPHRVGLGLPRRDLKWESYRGELTDATATLGEFFQHAGYRTMAVGKWSFTEHFEANKSTINSARSRGFDRFYGSNLAQTSYFEPKGLQLDSRAFQVEKDFYYTRAIGQEAIRFLEEADERGKPFFLYAAFTAPSWPLHAPEEEIRRYAGKYRTGWEVTRMNRFQQLKQKRLVSSRMLLSPKDERVVDWRNLGQFTTWQARRMEVYAAQVSAMDRAIGQILDQLVKMGAKENTLVIFLSDAGGNAEELSRNAAAQSVFVSARQESGQPIRVGNDPQTMPGSMNTFQSYGVPWANVSNTPFRGYAKTLYEGGLRTPCILRWPSEIAVGKVSEPVHVIDLFATLVDVSETAFPRTLNGKRTLRPVGESIRNLFELDSRLEITMAEERTERYFFWEFEGNQAVRFGKWKLHRPRGAKEWQLYDLRKDPTETKDVYSQFQYEPEIEEMLSQLEIWKKSNGVYEWSKVKARYQKIQSLKKEKR
ncbi:MAG: sulfatase-like hydrolase/transferase [Planctomycetia bacterium]|nr:sulfatase-like hydrolase/transferase [Planctomycetia bacterium]